MASPLGVACPPVAPGARRPWARTPARRPRCGVCASTGRPHHQPGEGNPPPAAPQPRLADFAAAFAALTQQAGGGAQQAPRLPSLSDSAEVLQALAQVMQQQVALAQAQATQLVDGYDDYDSYGADDGGGSRLGGGGASLAKARALAALARDRREVLQEERRARDGARVPPRGDIMLSSAGEGARGRDGRGDVSQGEDGDEDSAPPQRGMSASEEQRQQQVRSALASLRSAREAGDVGDVALWDADVEDSFQRQEAGAAGLRMAVHRFVPPPKARASEAPLGALGLLSDEFVALQPASIEPAADESSAPPPSAQLPPVGVPADVDAILSSALSELGLSMTAGDGADDRRITVSGEQMAAAVLAWQAREGAAVDDGD